MVLDVSGNRLDAAFIDGAGVRRDYFTLAKGASGAPPAAPSGLAAGALSSSQISLSWTDNAGNEDGFQVERSTDGNAFGPAGTAGANATGYTDTGLSVGTQYWYRVRAINAYGQSAYSNVVTATTPISPPAAPSGLTATAVSKSQINLAWKDSAGTESGFRIERSTNGTTFAQIATVGANVTAYQSTGLSANKTYYYRVRAYNAGGNSTYSNTAKAKTPRR
jgi:titin